MEGEKMALFVRGPLVFGVQPVFLPAEGRSVWDLRHACCLAQGLPEDHFYVKCNGRCVNSEDVLQDGAVYSLEPRLCGGKGGFGSMLRALGAQIEKTTNREACRDLSGRRLRDVNHEKAMAEWVKQQAEREADKEQRRLERLKRKLAEPKHVFTNPDYQQQCHEMAERLEDSVLKGMQASSSIVVSPECSESRKRPNESEKGATSEKKMCFWMGVEGLEDADSSQDSSDSEDDKSPSASGSSSVSANSHVDAADGTEEPPSSSEDSLTVSSVSDTAEKSQVQMELAKNGVVEDLPASEAPADEKHTSANEECEGAKTLKEREQASASSPAEAVSQSLGTETSRIDLLEFNSVVELEALGLDQLKFELMALGLKCGGTLQERAARLFSVRGLSREQIDPTLFVKPSKGKKK
ncbi:Replication stress response regulator SDE2 [Varanus komodoensis]|uniref:Replication stress response regulator SDE2 n=1 Tax=Varanus komodoensis TaxID=61221 RepID=A0A8D2LM40_VARKO|nr:replication stress response regulator SDE2 [Varanus komodoensis]KAF7254674.1 Replication stress response regulator SDE2 [Varanus komodoensis]